MRKLILLGVIFLCVSVPPVFGSYLYGVGQVGHHSNHGFFKINPVDMSYEYFDGTAFLRDATGLAYVPEPTTLLLLGLGGLILRRKR